MNGCLSRLVRSLRKHTVDRVGWHRTRVVFILSTGRVGTVTMVKVMNCSEQILAVHEPEPSLLEFLRESYYRAWTERGRFGRLFAKARRQAILDARARRKVYCEATLVKFFAPAIADLMPDAKFIHAFRHPGGVIRSAMRRGWYNGHPYDGYRLIPSDEDSWYKAWHSWDPFAKNCWMWSAENAFFIKLRERIGPERVLRMPFEEWTDPDSGAYRRIFEFLDLPTPPESSVREVLSLRSNVQEKGEFPVYDEWTDAQKETLQRIAGPVMNELGYS